jgi:hypothetical protein
MAMARQLDARLYYFGLGAHAARVQMTRELHSLAKSFADELESLQQELRRLKRERVRAQELERAAAAENLGLWLQ